MTSIGPVRIVAAHILLIAGTGGAMYVATGGHSAGAVIVMAMAVAAFAGMLARPEDTTTVVAAGGAVLLAAHGWMIPASVAAAVALGLAVSPRRPQRERPQLRLVSSR
jgi:hypothetical protein